MSYARFRCSLDLDALASYPAPISFVSGEILSSPTKNILLDGFLAGAAGAPTSLSLASMTTLYGVIIKHDDLVVTSNVTVTWSSAVPTACDSLVKSGGLPLVLTSVSPAVALTFVSVAPTTPKLKIFAWGV